MSTQLIETASRGKLKIIQLLIRREAELDARNESLVTPLMSAASEGDATIVKIFLEQSTDETAEYTAGNTTLLRSQS